MPPANRVLVLRAKEGPFDRIPYVIHVLSRHWRAQGIEVEVLDSLTQATGSDVLVIPHIDLTLIPRQYAELLDHCSRVINRSVLDISKRAVSKKLIASPDEYDGPVIVKTNRNFGGFPEARMAAARAEPAPIKQVPWLHWTQYRVYNHPRIVPPLVWSQPLLVVEKFLPEMEGDLYCLRQYVFFGQCEMNLRSISSDPVVKAKNVIRRETLDSEPPAGVRELREQLGFDFGKFDYVMHGDEPIVFDVNRTPTYNPSSKAGSVNSLIAGLAPGIHSFLASV